MKNFTTLLVASLLSISVFAQDTESYTALKVTGDNVPVIDGNIDAIWEKVEIVPLTKVPEIGGVVHSNITVPDPETSDFYAEIGMLWNNDGIFFIFSVTDDKIVIVEDHYLDNDTPADKWWYDDNINILFSKDLYNWSFQQWEFAWQPGIDQEEKLSSDDWANPAEIDTDLVQSAWYNDGDIWILETFIDWKAFDDGLATITPDSEIFLEARARDDDDEYMGSSWEAMFQWSTLNYEVEATGEGMGTVTLSSTELQASGISDLHSEFGKMSIHPNPSRGKSELQLTLLSMGSVDIAVSDMTGKLYRVFQFQDLSAGENSLALDLTSFSQGVYFLSISSGEKSGVLKYVKQ